MQQKNDLLNQVRHLLKQRSRYLFFGYKLPEVAGNLQLAIDSEIKKLTGLQVHKVDIIIREIDEPVEER